jgi:hypothetical protein
MSHNQPLYQGQPLDDFSRLFPTQGQDFHLTGYAYPPSLLQNEQASDGGNPRYVSIVLK